MNTLYRLLLGALLLTLPLAHAADPAAPPSETLILELEGRVEVSPKNSGQWSPGQTNQPLQFGDGLRTGPRSRATLRLADLTIARVKQLTTMEIQPPRQAGNKPQLNLRSGASYIFSREQPTEIEFRTPVASGAIRGTEFNLEVDDTGATTVTMIDGEVTLTNDHGALQLASNEQGLVEPGQAPRRTALLQSTIDIIQWALYYPAVLAPNELTLENDAQNDLRDSLRAYRQGDLLQALAAYPENRQPATEAERLFHAALHLAVGDVAPAQSLATNQAARSSSLAQALRELIAAVKNQPFDGPAPSTASHWLAHSYYQQSHSQLRQALHSARQAASLSPDFGAAWVRVAELEFSFGRTASALQALDKGLLLAPRHAQGIALKGFLLSAQSRFEEASHYFNHAIAIDGALGNAWLGRGLVKIRQGDGAGGRADLQVAATLEPHRSILRSYLGKAFSHNGENDRAKRELELARKLDPNDPTPWLYESLLDQRRNEINDAIAELEQSQRLNQNRSVYRSQMLLDQDQAVRSANLAAIYRDAGMLDLSRREASRAVNYDYANYSAHLFLANSYDALRDPQLINLRYETPWFSELLVANLLAPVGAGNLSQSVSQQEYSRMFEGNHIGLFSDTEYFSSGEWRQSGAQYGIIDNTSYSLDAYYRTAPGQRRNNDQEQLALSTKVKQQLSPNDSVFLQAQYYNTESGDVAQYYNQHANLPGVKTFDPTLRVKERQEPNVFLGYHRQWRPGSHTLFLVGRLDDEFELSTDNIRLLRPTLLNGVEVPAPAFISRPLTSLNYNSDFDAYSAELQQIWQQAGHTVVLGGRFQSGDSKTTTEVTLPDAPDQEVKADLTRHSLYGYYFWQIAQPLQLVGGVSYDYLDYPENIDIPPPVSSSQTHQSRVSPKAGFYFQPINSTILRGIYSRSLGGLFYDTSVRLEPTQIAGFNQAFRSIIPESEAGLVPGSQFETFGLALDHRIRRTGTYLSVSAELLKSKADREVGALVSDVTGGVPTPFTPTTTPEDLDYEEKSLTFVVNQLIGKYYSLGASYRITEADLEDTFAQLPSNNQDVSATLHQVDLYAIVNLPCGFFAQWDSVWSQQSNRGYSPDIPGDDFWQHHAYVGYRFLQRRAEARLGLLNITDRDYRLNPLTLYNELPRERTLAASLRFYF